MNITVIADPVVAVPPRIYGGAERVIAALCEELARRGHRIVLMAGAGSKNYGKLITHVAPNNASLLSRAHRKILFQPISLAACWRADIVHNFSRIDYLWSVLRTRQPVVQTFENPIGVYDVDILSRRREGPVRLVSVSDSQRVAFNGRGSWSTIHNSVDVDAYRFSDTPSDPPYFAFLGRLTRNKGVHLAIEAARKAGIKLKIAGNISKETGGEAYFEEHVRPALGSDIEWVGEVDDAQKSTFLGGATALFFPIQWDEPCAVVIGETLACGTPIIALRRACTPELVQHGKTGFLCSSVDEMVEAVGQVGSLRRADCRAFAESELSATVMTDRYLQIYRELLRAR